MICTACNKDFIQIGRKDICPPCALDAGKSTKGERVEEVEKWLRLRGLIPHWISKESKEIRKYDGIVAVPNVGIVRIGVGRLTASCEMSVSVSRTLKYGEKEIVRYRCARVSMGGVKKPWSFKMTDIRSMLPGECKCRGCGVKEYIESCIVEPDVL